MEIVFSIFLKLFFGSVFMSYKCAKSVGDRDTFPLRKHGIISISKPIDKLFYRCTGKIFKFNFLCNVINNSGGKSEQTILKYFHITSTKKSYQQGNDDKFVNS